MWDSEPKSGTVNYLPFFHELMIRKVDEKLTNILLNGT